MSPLFRELNEFDYLNALKEISNGGSLKEEELEVIEESSTQKDAEFVNNIELDQRRHSIHIDRARYSVSRIVEKVLGYRRSKISSRSQSLKFEDDQISQMNKFKKPKGVREMPIFVSDAEGYGNLGCTFGRAPKSKGLREHVTDIPPVGAYFDLQRTKEEWTERLGANVKFVNQTKRPDAMSDKFGYHYINDLNPVYIKQGTYKKKWLNHSALK